MTFHFIEISKVFLHKQFKNQDVFSYEYSGYWVLLKRPNETRKKEDIDHEHKFLSVYSRKDGVSGCWDKCLPGVITSFLTNNIGVYC